jgi:hypothetical protein
VPAIGCFSLQKARAAAAAAQTLQARAHESAVRAFCDGVLRLEHRLESLENKRAEEVRQMAALEASREEKFII